MATKVLFHAGCTDGFCAAWLWQRRLPPDTPIIPVSYSGTVPDLAVDDDVIIVDFSYSPETMRKIAESVRSLLWIDHHETAAPVQDVLRGLPSCKFVFDLSASGAMLCAKYLNETDERILQLVAYVNDRDLWRHELPDTHEVSAGLRMVPTTFQAWNEAVADPNMLHNLKTTGAAVLRYKRQLVDMHELRAHDMKIDGVACRGAVCSCGDIISEVGERLALLTGVGVCYTLLPGGHWLFSLRSRDIGNGVVKVNDIAKKFGGGGHPGAAGFTADTQTAIMLGVPVALQQNPGDPHARTVTEAE